VSNIGITAADMLPPYPISGRGQVDSAPGVDNAAEWKAAIARLGGAGRAFDAADVPDSGVTGLWLEMPDFPANTESRFEMNDEGAVLYVRQSDGGDFTLTILRMQNPNNAVTTENAVKLIVNVMGIDEDDFTVYVNERADRYSTILAHLQRLRRNGGNEHADMDSTMLVFRYPSVLAMYEIEEDGEIIVYGELFLFPESEFFFWVRMEGNSAAEEKYGRVADIWRRRMRLVER